MEYRSSVTGRLTAALALGPREHVALVGGGGKTSLLLAAAEECRRDGKRVVASTTTKVFYREALKTPCTVLAGVDPSWREGMRRGLERHGLVFLGQDLLDSGKLQGVSTALSDELFADPGIDYLFTEADGASGHPVKAHAGHEPVIAGTVTKVVAVMGLDGIGRPMSEETVFRTEQFRRLTGCGLGEPLTPHILARVFSEPLGLFKGRPEGAGGIVFLNKADLLNHDLEALAGDLARLVLEKAPDSIQRAVIGSIKRGSYMIMGRGYEGDLFQDP